MWATLDAGAFREALVYIQITRGAAPRRAHKFPADVRPLELLWVDEFNDPYGEARQHGAAALLQPDNRWDRCDIKSTNLLGNVLAMQAAVEADCVEALLYLPDGTITEGTHTSCFGVRDGTVLTAPNSNAILPGITRGLVMRLADRADISVREGLLKRSELDSVAELFITGTTSEVLPIVKVDGQPIGGGVPGPITRSLQEAYREAVAEFVAQG